MSGPVTVRLSDVQPERVRQLWRRRIFLGKLNMLDGDPGLGKTTMLLDIAARTTTGAPMPDGTTPDLDGPASVVILTAEDGLADTIRPRLDAAGADVSRVVAIKGIPDGHAERPVEIPFDVQSIYDVVDEEQAALVIVDPFVAFLGTELNSYKDQDVRRAMAHLARLAEDTGAAVVLIRHLNKLVTGNPLYRGGGSIGIIGAARSGLLVARDPDDETRLILAVTKSNLAAMPPAMAYRLEPTPSGVARVRWEGPTHHTAADLLSRQGDARGERELSPERKAVVTFVLAQDAPVGAKDVAEGLSIKEATARWHLAEAAREGHIERVATGMYAAPTSPTPNNTNKSNGPDTGRVNSVGVVGVVGVGGGSNGANPTLPCRACGRAVTGQPDPNRPGWLRFSCACGLTDFARANDPGLKMWR